MRNLVTLSISLLLASSSLAAPTSHGHGWSFPPLPPVVKDILCCLPIPVRNVQKILCPRQGSTDPITPTPIGSAHGVIGTSSVARYAVRCGQAARWQPSSVVTSWQFPTGNTAADQLPLACPQTSVDASGTNEDCLSMILYVPSSLTSTSNAPTLVWIHGGSFTDGSATGPGLDGSHLAVATNSIVAVVQYRLGALGLMAPNGNLNLALGDIITALQFIHQTIPSFGGSTSKVTVAGQSSGATMIRGLLAAPSAASLFQSAILESDPMDYGFLSTTTQSALQSYFNGLFSPTCSTAACWNALSVSDILDAQVNLVNAANSIDRSTGLGEPLRLVHDGTLITSPLDNTASFPSQTKHLLLTNVKNEAGVSIYGNVPAIEAVTYGVVVNMTFGDAATTLILENPNYAALTGDNADDQRPVLEKLGTDQIWRCPGWTFARNWAGNGGTAYVGMYLVGASYPGNSDTDFCTGSGVVCHMDDIEIVFGTVPDPNTAQSALITEVQARYKAFLNGGNPNAPGFATWQTATTTDVHALFLGGTGEMPAGGCDPSFFGSAIQYDWQVFNI